MTSVVYVVSKSTRASVDDTHNSRTTVARTVAATNRLKDCVCDRSAETPAVTDARTLGRIRFAHKVLCELTRGVNTSSSASALSSSSSQHCHASQTDTRAAQFRRAVPINTIITRSHEDQWVGLLRWQRTRGQHKMHRILCSSDKST